MNHPSINARVYREHEKPTVPAGTPYASAGLLPGAREVDLLAENARLIAALTDLVNSADVVSRKTPCSGANMADLRKCWSDIVTARAALAEGGGK